MPLRSRGWALVISILLSSSRVTQAAVGGDASTDQGTTSGLPVPAWVLYAGVVAVLLLLGWVWRATWRKRGVVVPVVDWQGRAESAERRAGEAEAVVKAGLIPHLARFLRGKLLVGLLRQRSQLVEGQHEGAERTQALDKRLAAAQGRLQEKLAAYEKKISQLEGQQRPTSGGRSGGKDNSSASGKPHRRSPFAPPRRAAEPDSVEFRDILRRRQGGDGTGKPGEGA